MGIREEISRNANTGRILFTITPKLRGIFIPGRRYKKSGVLFFGLESEDNRQIDLFADTAREEKDDRLSKALDKINTKYGRGTIFHFSEGDRKAVADASQHTHAQLHDELESNPGGEVTVVKSGGALLPAALYSSYSNSRSTGTAPAAFLRFLPQKS